MIAVGAQVDRRVILAGVQLGQPVCALADPADLVDQAVADQVAPVQLGVIIRIGIFGGGPARSPQLPQGGIQLVQVRGRRDLVHPGRDSAAAAASVRIETPSARAEDSAQPRSRSAWSRCQAARDTRRSTRRSRRQATIRSVIVTMTPWQVFSELDS